MRTPGLCWTAVLVALTLSACGPSGPVRAALYGDLSTLRQQIQVADRQGKLQRHQVLDLALAVAKREIASAQGPAGARHLRGMRGCARPLLPELRRRSQVHDEVGAEAMMTRIVMHDISEADLVSLYAKDPDAAWRAVAARAASDRRDLVARRAWFVDPDERVRRAALEAAILTPDGSDLEVLLETLRLDPDPLGRSMAARGVGAIGGEPSVLGLKDRFARADEAGRLTIVEAWAMPRAYAAGGARELRLVAEDNEGVVSVAAAHALFRSGEQDGALSGLLAERIEHGSDDERRLAMMLAPLSDQRVSAALSRAARDVNPEVRVIALARTLEANPHSADALKGLREMAAQSNTTALEAQNALSAAGDRSVIRALVEETQHGHPARRGMAAVALFRLGESARAAVSLADSDPGVRVATACGILALKP